MSYKIVCYALMKHINKAGEINVPLPAPVNPRSALMDAPQRLSPEQLPDPWLLDTEGLLSELARIRDLALRIPPVRNDVSGRLTLSLMPCGTSKNGCDTASICIARRSDLLHDNTIKN